jgi:hypothetical protein
MSGNSIRHLIFRAAHSPLRVNCEGCWRPALAPPSGTGIQDISKLKVSAVTQAKPAEGGGGELLRALHRLGTAIAGRRDGVAVT